MMTTLRGIFNNKELILFLAETAATTKIEMLNKDDTLLQQGLYTAARYQRKAPFHLVDSACLSACRRPLVF